MTWFSFTFLFHFFFFLFVFFFAEHKFIKSFCLSCMLQCKALSFNHRAHPVLSFNRYAFQLVMHYRLMSYATSDACYLHSLFRIDIFIINFIGVVVLLVFNLPDMSGTPTITFCLLLSVNIPTMKLNKRFHFWLLLHSCCLTSADSQHVLTIINPTSSKWIHSDCY